MRAILVPLAIVLLGCASEGAPEPGEPAPAAIPAPDAAPGNEPAAAPVADEGPVEPDDLPASIPLGASITRSSPDGGTPVTVSSTDGRPVRWSRTEVSRTPMPFDAGAVRAACTGTHVFPAFREEEQEHVRLDCEVRGLPEDVFFLELVPGESLVDWVDGTRGSIHSISHQGRTERSWSLYLLTTPPPLDPGIRSARIALRVHQSLRADRHEAAIGIGEVALFDFGVTRLRWVVTSDLRLTEFGAGAYRKPISPALDAGLRYDSMVRLVDAGGIPLREEGGGGAGTQFINEWAGGGKSPLVPPVRVVVEVPSKTSTTQVVVTLADIRPKR